MGRIQPMQPTRVTLTDRLLRTIEVRDQPYVLWDTMQQGLAVRIYPTGTRTFLAHYRHEGRLRWCQRNPRSTFFAV